MVKALHQDQGLTGFFCGRLRLGHSAGVCDLQVPDNVVKLHLAHIHLASKRYLFRLPSLTVISLSSCRKTLPTCALQTGSCATYIYDPFDWRTYLADAKVLPKKSPGFHCGR